MIRVVSGQKDKRTTTKETKREFSIVMSVSHIYLTICPKFNHVYIFSMGFTFNSYSGSFGKQKFIDKFKSFCSFFLKCSFDILASLLVKESVDLRVLVQMK